MLLTREVQEVGLADRNETYLLNLRPVTATGFIPFLLSGSEIFCLAAIGYHASTLQQRSG